MTSNARNILFRCDAGSHIGGGHLIRCLAFADALKPKGCNVSFLCNEQAWEFPALINSSYQKVTEDSLGQRHYDYIIFDHYGLEAKDEEALRPYCDKILVIDDLADRPHDCDMLIDFSPSRKAEDYSGLVPDHCQRFIGIEYLILRPEFFDRAKRKPAKPPYKIFVTMGSIDGRDMLPPLLDYLETQSEALDIHVMMTCKTRTRDMAEEKAKRSKHNVTLHMDIKNPAPIMEDCDLAISAGGMTSLELVALGIPTLVFIIADNQKENAGFLDNNNYVKLIHDIEELKTTPIKTFIETADFKKLTVNKTLKIVTEML